MYSCFLLTGEKTTIKKYFLVCVLVKKLQLEANKAMGTWSNVQGEETIDEEGGDDAEVESISEEEHEMEVELDEGSGSLYETEIETTETETEDDSNKTNRLALFCSSFYSMAYCHIG